jgi:hypothetical protein
MKAVCRKAGISKWPYRRIQFYKSRGMQFNAEEVFQSGSRMRRASKRECLCFMFLSGLAPPFPKMKMA